MRPSTLSIALIVLPTMVGALAREARGDVTVGVRIDSHGCDDFHLALASHYGYESRFVASWHSERVPEDHLPVVCLIAKHAHVTPRAVLDLRLAGHSWMDISLHFGLSAELFHVEVANDYGPPYGRALGHYKKLPRSQWASIRLSDDDVVLLANVKFLSARYGHSPDAVIRLHGEGGFIGLHGRVKAHKGPSHARVKVQGGGGGPAKAVNKRALRGPSAGTRKPAARAPTKARSGGGGRGRGKKGK